MAGQKTRAYLVYFKFFKEGFGASLTRPAAVPGRKDASRGDWYGFLEPASIGRGMPDGRGLCRSARQKIPGIPGGFQDFYAAGRSCAQNEFSRAIPCGLGKSGQTPRPDSLQRLCIQVLRSCAGDIIACFCRRRKPVCATRTKGGILCPDPRLFRFAAGRTPAADSIPHFSDPGQHFLPRAVCLLLQAEFSGALPGAIKFFEKF